VIFASIAAAFFFTPIFITGLASQGAGFEKSLFFYFITLVGVVAWATKGVTTGELKLKRTPLDIPILALLSIFTLSSILSVSRKDSFIGFYGSPAKSLAAVFVIALFYYLVVNNLDIKKIKKLFWVVLASGSLLIIHSVFALFKINLLPIEAAKTAGFNLIGSNTGLTIYLVCLLPFFVVGVTLAQDLLSKLRNRYFQIGIQLFVGLMLLASLAILFLLNGFTYWPVAIVSIVVVLMFMLAKVVEVKGNFMFIPIGVFLLTVIFLVMGNFAPIDLKLPTEVSLSRGISYNIAKESLKENPLFGSGLGTYYYNFAKFKGTEFNNSPLWNVRFDSSTGIIFELIATVGVLGALSVIVLFLILTSMSSIALIKPSDKEVQPVLLASFASLITLMLYAALFSFNTALVLSCLLLAVFAAGVSVNTYPEKLSTLNLSFRSSPKFALALAAIFLSVTAGVAFLFTMGIKIYLADIYAKKFVTETDSEKKIQAISKSISLANFQDSYYLSLGNYYMSLANQEVSGGKDQNKIQNYLNLALQNSKRGSELNPNYVASIEALAIIYENASFYTRGALELAESNYAKVIELEPTNPIPHLRMALINMARSNSEKDESEKSFYIEEAIKKYDEAISKKQDFAAAYYGKAIANEQLKKNDDAIDQLKNAVLFAGNNVDYQFELGRMYFNRGVTQPNIAQSASKEIAEGEINSTSTDSNAVKEDLSVKANQMANGTSALNEDLRSAEQLFMNILTVNPNHANALYSLGLLYQKTDQEENAKIVVAKLLEVLQDDQSKDLVRKQFVGLY